MPRINIIKCAAAVAVILSLSVNTYAIEIGEMGDINDLAQDFGWNDSYQLSDDFFDNNLWDELGSFGNLANAENNFDYSFKVDELKEEYDGADHKYQDDGTYVVVYKSRGMEIPYTVTHILLRDPGALSISEDFKKLSVKDLEGKEVYYADIAPNTQIMNGSGRTEGKEVALRSDGQLFTPDKNMDINELKEKEVVAVFNSYYPFFWSTLDDSTLKAIGYGSELSEKEEESEEKETEKAEEEAADPVDHEKNIKAAIGASGPGDYYIFQCSKGMEYDEAGAIMASYGCTYSAPIESTKAFLNSKQVFGGSVPDGYKEEETEEE